MYRFVSDHTGGVGSKRKHSLRPCEPCRKRHKRCPHTHSDTASTGTPSTAAAVGDATVRPTGSDAMSCGSGTSSLPPTTTVDVEPLACSPTSAHPSRHGFDTAAHHQAPSSSNNGHSVPRNPQSDAYLRFVGDLSPEASFLANKAPPNGRRDVAAPSRYESRHQAVGVWLGQKADKESPEEIPRSSTPDGGDPGRVQQSTHRFMLPTLTNAWAALRRECLSTLPPEYDFRQLHDLYYAKIDPIFPILRDEALDQHNPMEAAAMRQSICLVAALDPSMRRFLRLPHTERVLSPIDFRAYLAAAIKQSLDMGFIQDKIVLLQVSALMAFYVDRPEASELSPYYCAQTVHLSQGLGLHLGWPGGSIREQKSRRLFWCVWVLDRFNAATNGRPVLTHSRDMDKRVIDAVDIQAAPFKLLIRITQLLDETISQYRPHSSSDTEARDRQSSFESLVQKSEAVDVNSGLLASLEMFYLAVVILRSRPRDPEEAGGSIAVGSELQSFCATSIVSIASEEYKNTISFWPLVPYAVSMATSVAYKSLRNSTLPNVRKRAYDLFHSSCEVLDELSKAFLSARTMARLAIDTLQQVERVAVTRVRPNRSTDADSTLQGAALPVEAGPPAAPRTRSNPPNGDPSATLATDIPFVPALGGNNFDFDLESFNNFLGEGGFFAAFDPSFDLDRTDAVFSAALDPTLPNYGEEWMGPF